MTPIAQLSRTALRTGVQRLSAASTVSRSVAAVDVSRVRMTSTSTMHDNDAELLDREKHRNLSGQNFGVGIPDVNDYAPGWNEKLASASEAVVKADRAGGSPTDMQRRTVEYMRVQNDPENREGSTNAIYLKDEVTGPLQTAQGHEAASTDDALVNEGHVLADSQSPQGRVRKESYYQDSQMTSSEEDVKADRGDI